MFFRHSAKQKAKELDIKGFARNESDGSLSIEVEGDENNLKKFLEWCSRGTPPALIEKIEHKFEKDIQGFNDF